MLGVERSSGPTLILVRSSRFIARLFSSRRCCISTADHRDSSVSAAIVIAQKRENAERFPFDNIDLIAKRRAHFWTAFLVPASAKPAVANFAHRIGGSYCAFLTENETKMPYHIFFGHIAVHLLPLVRAWPRPSIVSFHGADVLVDMEKPAYRKKTKEMLDSVHRVFVRSESLRRAVVDLGCAENKIDIVRTGIPLRGISVSRSEISRKRRVAIRAGVPLDRKEGVGHNAARFHSFSDPIS